MLYLEVVAVMVTVRQDFFAITKSFMTANEYWTSQYFKCWYTYFDIRKIYELKKLVSYYFEFE